MNLSKKNPYDVGIIRILLFDSINLCSVTKIYMIMEVVTIESDAFNALMEKIDKIAEFVVDMESNNKRQSSDVWLDSHELSDMLSVSMRTLQRLRDDGLLAYTVLRGRCLYKLSDIEEGLTTRTITAKPQELENFRKKFLTRKAQKEDTDEAE